MPDGVDLARVAGLHLRPWPHLSLEISEKTFPRYDLVGCVCRHFSCADARKPPQRRPYDKDEAHHRGRAASFNSCSVRKILRGGRETKSEGCRKIHAALGLEPVSSNSARDSQAVELQSTARKLQSCARPIFRTHARELHQLAHSIWIGTRGSKLRQLAHFVDPWERAAYLL